jgi:Transcription initiation factor TFIID subunit A
MMASSRMTADFSSLTYIHTECHIFFQTVSSACALAKHRKANNIEVDDVKVMLHPVSLLPVGLS